MANNNGFHPALHHIFYWPTYELEISEEEKDLPMLLLQLMALPSSGDNENVDGFLYLVTGDGVDDENPSLNKFAINSRSGELFLVAPLDRDLPLGKPKWSLNIYVEDDNGNVLQGNATVDVSLKDINDNAPVFTTPNYVANMTENQSPGIKVLQVTATDYDDPDTNGNGLVRYSIELNRVDPNGDLIFFIDEESGDIRTLVCCLDRELISLYEIRVVAKDGAGLRANATVIVNLIDEVSFVVISFRPKLNFAAVIIISPLSFSLRMTNRRNSFTKSGMRRCRATDLPSTLCS